MKVFEPLPYTNDPPEVTDLEFGMSLEDGLFGGEPYEVNASSESKVMLQVDYGAEVGEFFTLRFKILNMAEAIDPDSLPWIDSIGFEVIGINYDEAL